MPNPKVQRLEPLVLQAAQLIAKLRDENAKLGARVTKLTEDNGYMELQFRRFKALSQRQERLREKLERLVKKLDKALELAG
jgi:hypothetical protein